MHCAAKLTLALVVAATVIANFAHGAAPPPSIYGEDSKDVGLTMQGAQIVVGLLIFFIFALLAAEKYSPQVLLLTALIITLLLQILTLPEALSGFSNESMITIGALFLVVGGVEKSHIVDWMARKTFGTDGSVIEGKTRMYIACFCLSIFFNNTPLVAILLPVVKDWGRMRNVAASQLLIPLSYSIVSGSFISMIGTSTNLTLQGLMQADRGYSFSFFAPAPIGGIAFVGMLAYLVFAGPILLPDQQVGLFRTARDKAASMMAEIYVSPESKAAGKSVGEVMNSLGVAPTSVIKIRRRVYVSGSSAEEGAIGVNSKSPSAGNILDMNYMRKHARAWTAKSPKRSKTNQAQEPVISDDKNSDDEDFTDREYTDIVAPAAHEIVAPHDVLFVSSAQELVKKMMKSIAGESKGLRILNSNAMALPGFGTELLECVVSDSNPFLGMKVSEMAKKFADKYKAGLITVRGKDWNMFRSNAPGGAGTTTAGEKKESDVENALDAGEIELAALPLRPPEYTAVSNHGEVEDDAANDDYQLDREERLSNPAEPSSHSSAAEEASSAESAGFLAENLAVTVSDHVLGYGDIILCVSNEKEVPNMSNNRDFFVVSSVGSLPKPFDLFKSIPVLIFVAMLILVATEKINMCSAALSVSVVFLLGGWINTNEIPQMVDVKLLLLIGSSISFAKAVTKSGLSLEIAKIISHANGGPTGSLFLVYALNLAVTELISNNAAAALMYPIAVALADELGVSFKPFAMAVMIASSSCFACPIGYQTHMMVWAPGGYKFQDFVRFGIVPDILYWVVACLIIPVIFPFEE